MRLTQRPQITGPVTLAELNAALPPNARGPLNPPARNLDTLKMMVALGKATQADFRALVEWAVWFERAHLDQAHELEELRERCRMLAS
jgi:hypothetical protein